VEGGGGQGLLLCARGHLFCLATAAVRVQRARNGTVARFMVKDGRPPWRSGGQPGVNGVDRRGSGAKNMRGVKEGRGSRGASHR